jgi:hypothetical protein
LVIERLNPKLEDPSLSFGCSCLFNVFAAAHCSWKPSFHLQPKDAPRCGESDPPNMGCNIYF